MTLLWPQTTEQDKAYLDQIPSISAHTSETIIIDGSAKSDQRSSSECDTKTEDKDWKSVAGHNDHPYSSSKSDSSSSIRSISPKDPGQESDVGSNSSGLTKFLREIGEHPDQLQQRREDKVMKCVVCNAQDSGSDQVSIIQCSKCWFVSHQACVKLQFGLPPTTNGAELLWKCPGRCDKSTPLWSDDM